MSKPQQHKTIHDILVILTRSIERLTFAERAAVRAELDKKLPSGTGCRTDLPPEN